MQTNTVYIPSHRLVEIGREAQVLMHQKANPLVLDVESSIRSNRLLLNAVGATIVAFRLAPNNQLEHTEGSYFQLNGKLVYCTECRRHWTMMGPAQTYGHIRIREEETSLPSIPLPTHIVKTEIVTAMLAVTHGWHRVPRRMLPYATIRNSTRGRWAELIGYLNEPEQLLRIISKTLTQGAVEEVEQELIRQGYFVPPPLHVAA